MSSGWLSAGVRLLSAAVLLALSARGAAPRVSFNAYAAGG